MSTNETNLRNRPTATEYSDIVASRGSGQLNSINAYLQNDPVSYFYQKFKESENPFLRDDHWSEAARRGESENLIALLNTVDEETFDRTAYDKLSAYGDRMDYDSYMLALQIPFLDNTKKVERIDQATGVKFGDFTDREWANNIVTATTGRWDAEIIEANKENKKWLATLVDVTAPLVTLVGGATEFIGDILNLGEGLLYMLADWSNESNKAFFDNRGEKFLKAFANDDIGIATWLGKASYEFQRQYGTTVNAVEAYEQGYLLGEGNNFLERIANAEGQGAGYSTLGKVTNGISQAIGYMLPTIILGVVSGGSSTAATTAGKVLSAVAKVRSGIFYAGIFSGMVNESVKAGTLDGTSYKDLNAGKIIVNAALKSAAQYAVELALAGIIGLSGLDRLIGIGGAQIGSKLGASTGAKVGQAALDVGTKAAKTVVLNGLKNALKEGLEETFQDMSDGVIDYFFGADNNLDYRQRGIDKFTFQNLFDSFAIGALTSMVIGSIADIKVFVGTDRENGVDASGQTFKLGAFQTLNIRQSLATMQEWRNVINDEKASIEQKAKAMLALDAAASLIGDVYRNMGTERAITADHIITDMLKMQSKTEQLKALGTGVEYANKLWDTLLLNRELTKIGYEAEFKKAVKDRIKPLQKAGVDKVGSVVTTTTTTTTGTELESTVSPEVVAKVKAMLTKLGVKVIVGVNGNVVLKSNDIIFASNQLVETGDIENIVKGVAYDLALETVKSQLTPTQLNLIVTSYNKITGLSGSTDDAVKALLFDKEFYTHTLLLMKERRYQNPAFEVMLTLDQLISAKVTTNVVAGTVTENAYKTLLEKVRNNMRTGLVTFATSYAKLELGLIDNAILPTELKQVISEHKNVVFTEIINAGLKDQTHEAPAYDRVIEFDRAIAKYDTYITKEEVDMLKQKARSSSYNDRVDAYVSLVLLSKNFDTNDKVIYLPAFASNAGVPSALITKTISIVEKQFGVKWQDLIDGTYDPNDLTAEVKDLIALYGDMSNRASRHAIINHVLFHKSGKTFTLGTGGVLLQVISKDNFAKNRYLGPKGDSTLLADIDSGKVKTLADMAKIPLDPRLAAVTLTLDSTVLRAGVNGGHIEGGSEIILSKNDTLNVIMHEVTHITQGFFSTNNEYISGGNTDMFNLMAPAERTSLVEYIKSNFPMVHSFIGSSNGDVAVMYFMLAGEIQANTTMSSLMFEAGFRWKNKLKTVLVSPDGTKEWSMEPVESPTTKAAKIVAKQAIEQKEQVQQVGIGQTNEDRPVSAKKNLATFNDKRFWSGSVNLTDGVIEETHSYEEAKANDFHHSMYFSNSQVEKMANQENAFFWVDTDGTINGDWRDEINADIIEKISKQIQVDKPIKSDNVKTEHDETLTDKYNTELAPLPDGLPKNLVTDEPLTLDALQKLRDDPVIAKRMENAWLKRKDGTPLIFYRGWQSRYKNYEIHLATEGNIPAGIKIGEFYSIHYRLSKTFGTKIEGFLVPFPKKDIKVYNFNQSIWYDLYDYWTPTDLEIHDRLFKSSRAFTSEVAIAKTFAMAAGVNIEPHITKRLDATKLELWNLVVSDMMKDYNVSRDTAVSALAVAATWEEGDNAISGHPNHYTTDALLPVNALQGYKAILMNNVNEVLAEGVTTNLVILRGANPIKVTHSKKDINWDKVIKPQTVRYISNAVAWKSNLKYFIRKGIPIQVSSNVAAFVSNTTTDFDKLPRVLKDKILKGELTMFDIINFVATAKNMNDYTFQMIAKYIYHNEALAKLTFKDALAIAEDISDLAALEILVENPEATRTPAELKQTLADVNRTAANDPELAKRLAKSQRVATSIVVDNEYREVFPDQKQLLPIMMRHYTGSFTSIRHINNFGKLMARAQTEQKLIENMDTGAVSSSTKTWNWVDKMRRADVDYEYDEATEETLNDIDMDDKLIAIEEYITNELIARVNKMTTTEKLANAAKLKAELQKSMDELSKLNEEAINRRYSAVLANETQKSGTRKLETIAKTTPEEIAAQPRSKKNIKDHVRQAGRTITLRIAGLKRRYNSMPKSIQEAIDPKTYKLKTDYYTNMTEEQLQTLLANLKETAKRLTASIKASETRAANLAKTEARLAKLAAKELKVKETTPTKKTLKEKVDIIHKTTIVNQNFAFDSREAITPQIEDMLNTQWGKRTRSKVKGLNNNIEQNVHNGEIFFELNAQTLIGMSTTQAEEAVKWFMDTNIVGIAADSAEAQTYTAIKTYFLGYVLGQTTATGQFSTFNANLKTRLENHLRTQTSVAGTSLAVWNNVQGLINPVRVMMNASMEMAGVILTDTEKENLMLAAVSNDMDAIAAAQQAIIDRVNIEKTTKKTIWRKLTTLRSMAMLSNPITWLRNLTSNMILKRLNKVAYTIGSKVFTSKTAPGQFKMTGTITPEIQQFINDNFIDNKLFDTLVSKLSRYNPSDIQARFKDATGKTSKDAIFANMVIKSMYNEFYNQNLFNSKTMNNLHGFLMRQLSDNNYVREATVRYFGKIIAERGYSLATGVTDDIMSDFAMSAGTAMADYMHSDNFFNQIETVLAEKSEVGLFLYKLILPFGSASWNWFKAAIKFSPIGLGQSLYKLATLEQQVIKAESKWAAGKGQVSHELTEFLIRRDLGSGVIGTMSMILGMILSALGYVELEDDDYGIPKLRIGNVRIDISTIFGSSSALAGMALVQSMQDGDVMSVLDAAIDPLLNGFFLVQVLELDQYNNDGWASFTLNFLQQTLLSFIPNGIRWLSGATYTGTYKTNTFFERAVARIPFFGSVFGLEKKVNPYTGDQGNAWDIFNRVVPFFSVRTVSAMEEKSKALGINKTELRGQYEINGEAFELEPNDVATLNKIYGQWNADDLVEFYDNRTRMSVKTADGTFRELTYDQMTETQRVNAVQNIFSKNAEYAKIYAWLMAGNTYYASATDYIELKKLGITGKLFKGTKGFVKA